jgi:hypothetical protein
MTTVAEIIVAVGGLAALVALSRSAPQIAMVVVGLALLWVLFGEAWSRDRNVPADFQRRHPCPSTGKATGTCPGWVRDHVVPLCKGGPDTVENMQWQTVEEAKAKDRWECKP